MSTTVTMATRTVEVSGAWAGGTWIDAAVLAHAHRSARGGFDFTVRSTEVADALVAHGLASRVDGRTLRGSAAVAEVCDVPQPLRQSVRETVPQPRSEVRPEVRGWCSSTHHVEPVRAVVEGRRGRGAGDPWAEDVRLCGRCADLLGEAGFFQAA
jgi:hypothetical protein